MSEVKRYHVTDAGLVEGQALGRINVVLGADHDRVTADADRLRAELECSRGDFVQLERISDALQQRLTAADERADVLEGLLRTSLLAMSRIYEAGRDFIVGAGSDCDSVELMMENDPTAREIRAALKPAEGGGDEALTQFQSRDDMAGFLLHALSVLRSHHLYGELPSVTSCVHDCLRLIGEPIPPRGW